MEDSNPTLSGSSSRSAIGSNGADASSSPQLERIPESCRPESNDSDSHDSQLPKLQVANGEPEGLEPIVVDDADPANFDLVAPTYHYGTTIGKHKLEIRSELLFSTRHLQSIFDDASSLHLFSKFLHKHRRESVPLLTYYLEALKALRAIEYSNAVLRNLGPLEGYDFTNRLLQSQPTVNTELQAKARTAFELLARDELPRYITQTWIQTVSSCVRHRIIGTPPRHEYEGLAEVFCLTDPWRHDNPIVFMSDEFNRTTQYGVDYVIGRNCRFLQGPCTNPFSIHRIRKKLEAGEEHHETFLNYRRDGSPFMNLVMLAPLYDSRGKVRYFLGAQVDVSGLAMSSYGLDAMKGLVDEINGQANETSVGIRPKDEFTELAQILSPEELEVVRNVGGDMHRFIPSAQEQRGQKLDNHSDSGTEGKPSQAPNHTRNGSSKHRVLIEDPESPNQESTSSTDIFEDTPLASPMRENGKLSGVYENYLLVRPYPSLRILFTSPSMRVPGILQSRLLDRVGGSSSTREKLEKALSEGRGVTAKIKWTSTAARHVSTNATQRSGRVDKYQDIGDAYDAPPVSKGRSRWIHCTPLIGSNGKVGVWMIVIVDAEGDSRKDRRPAISRRTTSVRHHPSTKAAEAAQLADHSVLLDDGRRAPEARSQPNGDTGNANTNGDLKGSQVVANNMNHQLPSHPLTSPVPSLKNNSSPSSLTGPDFRPRTDKHCDDSNTKTFASLGIIQPGRSSKNPAIAPWRSPPVDTSERNGRQDVSKEMLPAMRQGPPDAASYASELSRNVGMNRPKSPGSPFDAGLDN